MSKQLMGIALSVAAAGCSTEADVADIARHTAAVEAECFTLDFETTSSGDPIQLGDVLSDVYRDDGIDVRVWRGADPSRAGLPVAFDSAHPTGGDWDLEFEDQGNLLISQECFDDADVLAGYVDEPDDDRHGATFEVIFQEPVCVAELTLLDIDVGETPTDVALMGAGDVELRTVAIDPLGNNTRDVVGMGDTCGVLRIVVSIPSSGAVDDIVVCREDESDPPEPPPTDDVPTPDMPPSDDTPDDPDDTEVPPPDVPPTDDEDDTEDPDDTEVPPGNEEVDTEGPPTGDTEPEPLQAPTMTEIGWTPCDLASTEASRICELREGAIGVGVDPGRVDGRLPVQ